MWRSRCKWIKWTECSFRSSFDPSSHNLPSVIHRGSLSIGKPQKIPNVTYSQWCRTRKSTQTNFAMISKNKDYIVSMYQNVLLLNCQNRFAVCGESQTRLAHSRNKGTQDPRRSILWDEESDIFGIEDEKPKPSRKSTQRKSSNTDKSTQEETSQNLSQIRISDGEMQSTEHLTITDHDKVSKLFPQPKHTLDNLQMMIDKKVYDVSFKQITTKHVGKNKINPKLSSWTSVVKVYWPEKNVFDGNAFTKSAALEKALYKTLQWLYFNEKINDKGKPIYDISEINELRKDINSPIRIEFAAEHEKNMTKLIQNFYDKINPIIKRSNQMHMKLSPGMSSDLSVSEIVDEGYLSGDENMRTDNIHNLNINKGVNHEYIDKVFGVAAEDKDADLMKRRSDYLYKMLGNRSEETVLPITSYRDKILETVESHSAVVIQGAPGCGKSTCVPSYVLDSWTEQHQGANCGVIVSEPRRVAALSLARRVAEERNEQMGDVCGHQVRLATMLPRYPGGGILYCTAGALLRRLAVTPDLPGCSHLILDEAHERSVDSDAVMTLAKRCMKMNPNLKVIVMSATIDTELFSRYFNGCPILSVPGFMHPVKSHFLEDLPDGLSRHLYKALRASNDDEARPYVDPQEIVTLINWINRNKAEGAILVFLPGWSEIKKVKDLLENDYKNRNSYIALPVHSRLSNADQQKIFSKSSPGVRKIILATNIAETSITINDVSYVIDSGVHKELKLLSSKGISSLESNWISSANVKQRKGRAGRVRPGECFHMYTKKRMETFDENPTPEILRVPLEKTVLDLKTYSSDEKIMDFLQQFPQPPSSKAVAVAIKDLQDLGALDKNENLTALGKRIVSFTTHPKLSKALVHATIFNATTPVLDIATILSNTNDVFNYAVSEKEEIRNFKKTYHPTSDHQALFWLHRDYSEIKEEKGFRHSDEFCKSNNLRKERLDGIKDLREILVNHLQQCKMLSSRDYIKGNSFGVRDDFSGMDELIKGILFSGLGTLLQIKNTVKLVGKLAKAKMLFTDNGHKSFIASDSVNYHIERNLDSGLLMYCGAIHSEERRGILVKDTSVLSPLTVFLFCSRIKQVYSDEDKVIFEIPQKKIKMEVSPETAETLQTFRHVIWETVNYFVSNEGFANSSQSLRDSEYKEKPDDYITVNKFRKEMLQCLAEMLIDSEKSIFEKLKIDC